MSELLDLNWDVFVTPGIPTVTSDLPPGTKQQMWSPISSTLNYGKRDAVLVDAFLTGEPAGMLVRAEAPAYAADQCRADYEPQSRRVRLAGVEQPEWPYPRRVVVAHERQGRDESLQSIEGARQYRCAFARVGDKTRPERE